MPTPETLDQALLRMAEREGQILAQQLHDTLCQSLLGVALNARLLVRAKRAGREIDLADLEKIHEQLGAAIEQSRSLWAPQILAEQPGQLPVQLEKIAQLFSSQLPCEFASKLRAGIPEGPVASLLYRVARESMQNIVRYGQASRARLRLESTQDRISLEITHDGRRDRADSNTCVLEGDGFLRRFVIGAGLEWQIDSVSGTSLRVAQAINSPVPEADRS